MFQIRFRSNRVLDYRALSLGPEHAALYETIQRWHYGRTGRTSAVRRRSTLNERIHWLMLFDRDPRKEQLSDKLLLKDHVAARLGREFVVPVLQVARHFDDLDLDVLPEQFVIKANHDAGSVEVVRQRATWDVEASRQRLGAALARTHGQMTGEWWYGAIDRKVFVEEFIANADGTPIADYKFHCSEGRVRFVQHLRPSGRVTLETILDRSADWVPTLLNNRARMAPPDDGTPPGWDAMVAAVETLAADFAYVRVDCYSVSGRVYVGEMTFAPRAAGFRSDGEQELGRRITFSTTSWPRMQ